MALPSFQARPLWGAPFGNLHKKIRTSKNGTVASVTKENEKN